MSSAIRATTFLGIVTGIAVFVVIAAIAPDEGPDPTALAQGLGMGAIVAAAPTGALMSGGTPRMVVSLGGAMTVAGMATTPGGNLAGLVMAVAGLPLLLAGASRGPFLTWGIVGSILGFGVVLAIGMYAGLAAGLGTVLALTLSIGVASSPLWLPGGSPPPPA